MKRLKKVQGKYKPIPPFKNYEEEADFWDTHSTVEYVDPNEKPVKINFIKEPKKDLVNVKVSPTLKKRIEDKAREYDISTSSLVRMWIVEKLNSSK